MVIRPVAKVDAEELLALYPESSLRSIEMWVSRCLGEFNWKKSLTLVAFCEGVLAGTSHVSCSSNILQSHLAEVSDFAVLPQYQGRGISSEMFGELAQWAKNRKIEELTLSVRQGTVAEAIYKHWGFVEYGLHKNAIREPWGDKNVYNEVLMCKTI